MKRSNRKNAEENQSSDFFVVVVFCTKTWVN